MRFRRRVFISALLGGAALLGVGWLFRPGKFLAFKHHRAEYFAGLAVSCDTTLGLFPLGTNSFRDISPADPPVPGMIRELHPEKIKVSPDGLWILVDSSHSRDGLVVTWEPEYGQTNTWNLVAGTGEGETKVMYAVRKF